MDDARVPGRNLLAEVRRLMLPRWRGIHESDVAWRRSERLPTTMSHAMCRHACAFLRRLMVEADRRNGLVARSPRSLAAAWSTVRGDVDPNRLATIPDYVTLRPAHYVLMGGAGAVVDLTADQFGLDPLSIHRRSAFFPTVPTKADPGLATTVRAWTRDPGCEHAIEGLARI
jgi:hypothetical protein